MPAVDSGGPGRTEARAVLLLGPTACGKSAYAMALAERLGAEIVSVDSAQVYRGMDIGTAKPDAAQRARVPHHLLDLRDPAEAYSAAEFAVDARRAIDAIRARGRVALLVGGTMLYAKALREGLAQLPSADPALRAALDAEAGELGWPAMHARLAQVDPETAARLAPNDAQRIQRALEIHALTGRPMAQLLASQRADAVAGGSAGSEGGTETTALPVLALVPQDRAALHRRIELRFDQMLAAGFLDEVRALVARGDLHPDLPSQRSVGYRQAWAYLAGTTDAKAFREAAIAATRRLAKRQLTWLRSMSPETVVDPLAADAAHRVEEAIARWCCMMP